MYPINAPIQFPAGAAGYDELDGGGGGIVEFYIGAGVGAGVGAGLGGATTVVLVVVVVVVVVVAGLLILLIL